MSRTPAESFATGNPQPILALDISPDDRSIVIGQLGDTSSRMSLTLWSWPAREWMSTIVERGGSIAARFAPSGRLLAYSGGDQNLVLLERLSSGRTRESFPLSQVKWLSFAWTRDRLVAGGTATRVWDATADAVIWTLPSSPPPPGTSGPPPCCALSPDGKRLAASGVAERSIVIHEIESGAIVGRIENAIADARAIAFDPTGTFLGAVSMNGDAALWNIATGDALLTKRLGISAGYYQTLRFHPDGKRVAFGLWSGFVQLFDIVNDVDTREQTQPLHSGVVRDIAFTSDGRWLLSGGDDAVIKVSDLL